MSLVTITQITERFLVVSIFHISAMYLNVPIFADLSLAAEAVF